MKRTILKASAVGISVGAPLIATLTQFPIWVERSSEATISGIVVFFAILSIVPLFKYFKNLIQSPTSPILWGLVFCVLYALSTILHEMMIVSFVGFVANLIGWLMFKIAGKEKTEEAK